MVVVATKEEYKMAKRRYKNALILQVGVGALNIIKALKDLPRDTHILNFGYAGSNNLPIGTEVNIKESRLYHPNVLYNEPTYKLRNDGVVCYTSSDFVTKTDITEAVVFDMELAYILALGFTDVESVKIVSDNLSLKQYENSTK